MSNQRFLAFAWLRAANTHRYEHTKGSTVFVNLLSLYKCIHYHVVLDLRPLALKVPTLI